MTTPDMRIGHGYDVHRFGEGDHIMLGGCKIDHDKGLVAHSDGDVLVHALCDALLGSVALGDIGQHFPDTDDQYKNIDSLTLLRQSYDKVMTEGYQLSNADITIVAQAPKISPHVKQMVQKLSDELALPINNINIKATTTEGLGFTGREEGIAVNVVVLVSKV